MLKASIIIPIYNAEKHLNQCVTSLLKQSLTEIEIICINDGSTDNSQKILESWLKKDTRITIINTAQKGAGHARNTGIKKAQGKYIAFVDSDDWVEPYWLEKLYNTAEKNKSQAAMCFPKCIDSKSLAAIHSDYFYKEKGFFTSLKKPQILTHNSLKIALPFISIVPWNKIYNRQLIQQNNILFSENTAHEDLPFYVKVMGSINALSIVYNDLYNYRVHQANSLSQKQNLKYFYDFIAVFSDIDLFIHEKETIKSYYLFKIKYLLIGLNGVFYSKKFTRKEQKLYFNKIKVLFKALPFPHRLTTIERIQYLIIKHGTSTLFKLKVYGDLKRKKKANQINTRI